MLFAAPDVKHKIINKREEFNTDLSTEMNLPQNLSYELFLCLKAHSASCTNAAILQSLASSGIKP